MRSQQLFAFKSNDEILITDRNGILQRAMVLYGYVWQGIAGPLPFQGRLRERTFFFFFSPLKLERIEEALRYHGDGFCRKH